MGWSRFFRRRWWDDERARELEAHLEIETDENIARGMTPKEARFAAQRKLGNELQIREAIYRMNTIGWLDTLWQDVRFGVRLMLRTPGFTLVALLSLTLGIGANTAIFQVMDAVRLRSLPVPHPEELAQVRITRPRIGSGNFLTRYAELSNPQWEQIRARQEGFSSVAAWAPMPFGLTSSGEVRNAEGLAVSGNFFSMLGIPAARGRLLSDADDRRGCSPNAVVISHAFWQREYGGDQAIVGRKIRLDNHLVEIVGVTPPSFHGIEVGRSYDVALPICAAGAISPDAELIDKSHVYWLSVLGRLRPGWDVERATTQLRGISAGLFQQTLDSWFDAGAAKKYLAFRLEATSCAGGFSSLRTEYTTPLWFLFGLSGLVLLASCVNLANLLLARASARELELGVRLATGASRWRVVRQLLTESLLLAGLGTAAGVAVARNLSALLVSSISTADTKLFVDLPTDWRVLGFAVAVIALTTLVFGLAPALRATGRPVQQMMRSGGRGLASAGHRRPGLQGALVVVQVALSMAMVVSAMLFALSLRNLAHVNTGHRTDGLLVGEMTISPLGTPDPRVAPVVRSLIERLQAVPGIQSVARTMIPPMRGYSMVNQVRVPHDGTTTSADSRFHHVSPGYFRTVGIPLVAGRDFDDRDRVGSKLVAIVNRTFAREVLQTPSPVGRMIQLEVASRKWADVEIIGMAEDAMYGDIREPIPPVVHRALDQYEGVLRDPVLMIRSNLPPAVLRASVVRVVNEVGPMIGVQFSSLSDYVRDATQRDRLLAALSAAFGVLALSLSAIGIYGVLSYLVVRRRQEIGVRLVLGATRGEVLRLIARRSLGWLAIGLAIGGGLSVVGASAIRSMLFGLAPSDPVALAGAAGLLAVTGAVATLVPAMRAARLHPTVAMKEE